MRSRRPYPQHPFPELVSTPVLGVPAPICEQHRQPSPKSAHILKSLATGARVLFDMNRKRALVYRFRHGLEEIVELSVRMLAWLVKRGYLVVSGREGKIVHYTPVRQPA